MSKGQPPSLETEEFFEKRLGRLKKIKGYLKNDSLEEAIGILEECCEGTDFEDQVLIFTRRFSALDRNHRSGILAFEDYEKSKSRLTDDILMFRKKVKKRWMKILEKNRKEKPISPIVFNDFWKNILIQAELSKLLFENYISQSVGLTISDMENRLKEKLNGKSRAIVARFIQDDLLANEMVQKIRLDKPKKTLWRLTDKGSEFLSEYYSIN